MAGSIVLPAGEVIILNQGKELLLNKSKTINRVTAVEGSFIENSYLKIKGELVLEKNAVFIIDEESSVYFEANSKLVMKAGSKIISKNNAELLFEDAAIVERHPTAKIID
jgi:hypothetical protein